MIDYSKYLDSNPALIYSFNALQSLKSLKASQLTLFNRALDLISYQFYGSEQFWWVIAVYNDIIDPLVIDGRTLSIPDTKELELAFFELELDVKNGILGSSSAFSYPSFSNRLLEDSIFG